MPLSFTNPMNIPKVVRDSAQILDTYFKQQGIQDWQLDGVCSRSFAIENSKLRAQIQRQNPPLISPWKDESPYDLNP